MRPLAVVGSQPPQLLSALRAALDSTGPAVLPRELVQGLQSEPNAKTSLPTEVHSDIAVVIETSGSTGEPKRVALTANALFASAAAVEAELGGSGQWLLALPTHYIAGVQVLIRSIMAGTKPIVVPAGHFSAENFAERVREHTAPLLFSALVPTQLARLVDAAEKSADIRRALLRVDALLVGGQGLPRVLRERASTLGLVVRETYGATETAGGCVYDGKPIGQTRLQIVDGELHVSAPMLADSYLLDDERTHRAFFTEHGRRWYRTADSAELVDGVLRITGRRDNVIISGGVTVSLDQVERIVQSCEGFTRAVVLALAHEEWGQTPVVVTDDAFPPDALALLRQEVASRASRAAAPSQIVQVSQIPLLPSGKPDRVALQRFLRSAESRIAN